MMKKNPIAMNTRLDQRAIMKSFIRVSLSRRRSSIVTVVRPLLGLPSSS